MMVNIDPNSSKPVYAGEETGTPVPAWWLGVIAVVTFACLVLGTIALIIIYGG
jgi:hypothetical protein